MLEINKNNLEKEIYETDKLIVLDFWASWCEPCKAMIPLFESVNNEIDQEKVKMVKVKVDDNRELARQFKVMSVPCLIFIKNGEVIEFSQGFADDNTILNKISSYLN